MNDPAAASRERDRELRARIDPLVGQLSFVGKFELCMRLMLEGIRQGFELDTATIDVRALPELPLRGAARRLERDGGGEEAQGQ